MKKAVVLLLCGALLAATAAECRAQVSGSASQRAYCNLTEVKVEVVSNAVRVTVVADGTIEWDAYPDFHAYYDYDPKRDRYSAKRLRRFSILISNARNQLGFSVKDISRYPLSHIEVSVPPESTTGVGVVLTLETFDPMRFRDLELQESRDQRRLIITAMSDRHYEVGEEKQPAVEREKSLRLEAEAGRVRLHALNVDFRQVADRLSEASGIPIVVDDAVKRSVTAHLEQPDVESVLRRLCEAYALTLAARDHGYYVSEPFPKGQGALISPAAYSLSALHRVPLAYLGAQAARSLLPDAIWPFVRPDEETNALLVSGPEALAQKVASDLQRLDRPGPLTELRLDLVEFMDQRAKETALYPVWGAGGQEQAWNPTEGTITIQTGLLGGHRLALRLRALERESKARLVTRATLRLQNGQPGELFVGQEQFIVSRSLSTLVAHTVPVDIGLRLNATAWTSGEEAAVLDLRVRATTVLAVDPETGLPELGVREARARLLAPLGKAVAVGGFTLQRSSETERGIAGAEDLPLIGWLFRDRSKETVRNDLVLLVTPQVVWPDAAAKTETYPIEKRTLEEGEVQ